MLNYITNPSIRKYNELGAIKCKKSHDAEDGWSQLTCIRMNRNSKYSSYVMKRQSKILFVCWKHIAYGLSHIIKT